MKRPKLKEKMDATQAKVDLAAVATAAAPLEPEPDAAAAAVVLLRCVACDGGGSMVAATFDARVCPVGGRVVVNAAVGGGWVFCGTERDESDTQPSVADAEYDGIWLGEYLRVSGAVVELLEGDDGEGWSGDESVGRFAVRK